MSVRSPRSIRLRDAVDDAIQALARRTGRDISSVINEMLDEALRMRRIPGIVFGDSRGGRVARIAGTGLDVWELIGALRKLDNDQARLRSAYAWLSEAQIRSALAYAEAYPDEVEQRLCEDNDWTPERVWRTHPFMRPAQRS